MFTVTLHTGLLKDASLHNMLGRLDFGYSKLDIVADYKSELFSCGVGSHGIRELKDYPRWSATIWDLVARLVAVGLYVKEALPEMPHEPASPRGASATRMCAVIEHWSELEETRRARVGWAQLTSQGRACDYVCQLSDDLLGTRTSAVFRHAPEVLQHWDLLARAVSWTYSKSWQLPERPTLRVPKPFEEMGKRYVGLSKVPDPARSGLERWLAREGIAVARPANAPSGIVPEDLYNRFMSKVL
ncbi:hypothetical protein ACG04Q_19285 [Roseateles sp. DXS20W]|uniref:Uncharacterized protein n=1 Tax=Pelomonas lactea TaxID=3299030 RepID=A0ABW7GP38_9BURK